MNDDNRIDIVASLDIPKTVSTIKEDLEEVKKQLDASRALSITCSIDKASIDSLQEQLTALGKNLTLDIGGLNINSADVNNDITQTVNAIQGNINKGIDVNIPISNNAISDFGDALKSIDDKIPDEAIEKLNKELDGLVVRVTKITPVFTQMAGETEKALASLSLKGVDKYGNIVSYVEKFDNLKDQTGKTTVSVTHNLGEIEKANKRVEDSAKAAQVAYNDFLKLKGQADVYSKQYGDNENLKSQIADLQKLVGAFDNTASIEKQRENIILIGNALKLIKVEVDGIKESTDRNTNSVEDWHRKQELLLQDYDILAAKIKKANLDINKVATRGGVNYNEVFNNIANGGIADSADYNKAKDALASIRKEFQLLNAQAVSDLPQNTIENLIQGISKADSQIKILAVDFGKLKNPSEDLVNSYEKLQALAQKFDFKTDFENETKESIDEKIKAYGQIKTALSNTLSLLKAVQKEESKSFRDTNAIETLKNRIFKTSAALEDYANKNKKAVSSNKLMSNGMVTYSERWEELKASIDDFKTKMDKGILTPDDVAQFKHLNEEIATFKKEADAANLTTSAFFRNMRMQLSQVLMQWISLQGAIRIIRNMVTEVADLDAAMINLKKVTDETEKTYREFVSSAQKQASELHTTTTAVVEQTAEWAKLGFAIEDAQKLSRNSAIYALVGEVDNATAVSDLVTVLKAFNQTAEDSILTVDALNKLGNTFATDAKSLGEGIAVSASALAMAGNDLNQSLALITGGTEITQNARETGNAIKVISLRIRGMKGALEELNEETEGIESISKIQTQILNLTKNKVNIFNDDGSFKSTYEILKQISEIYNDLSDTSKASLTEILFGKVRANQGLAIIQAFQSGQVEKAYETALNSAGSAQEEFDRISEGIQAHVNDLKQAFETLSNTVIKSDLVKFVVDSGTTILKLLNSLIDKLGTLPTILTGLAAFGGFKGVGKLKPNMPIYAPLRLCA